MDKKEGDKSSEVENVQEYKNDNVEVLIIEKEIKSDTVHKDQITGAQNINDEEFFTCGIENAFKVWNKQNQTCDYTIETHEPLSTMALTGPEKNEMLVAGLG